jgi:hypothetical protein
MGIANNEERYVGLLRLHLLDTHCIRKYHLTSFQNFRSLAPIVAFIHENETLRREAIHIEILYRIKPLRRKMVGLTYQWVGDQIFDTLAQPFSALLLRQSATRPVLGPGCHRPAHQDNRRVPREWSYSAIREAQLLFLALGFPAFSRNLFFSFLGVNEHIVGVAESLFLGLSDLAECPPVL